MRPLVQRAPGFPCALWFEGQGSKNNSGVFRAAGPLMRVLGPDERSDTRRDYSDVLLLEPKGFARSPCYMRQQPYIGSTFKNHV
jgi:hypothetical protein